MAATVTVYTDFSKYVNQGIDYLADNIKCMLIDATQAPDRDNDHFITDINAHEISVGGYTAGGQALASKLETIDVTNHRTKYLAADLSWTFTAGATLRYGVLYKDTGTPSTSRVVSFMDAGSTLTMPAGTFTISWNVNGIFTATAS